MKELTDRQKSVFDYLSAFIEEKGFAPSIREMCVEFKIRSTKAIHSHLKALEEKGWIKRSSNARSIEVIGRKRVINLPLVGQVAAGRPILAVENIEDTIPLAWDFAKNARDGFILRVKGDSMVDAGINEGDLILVKPQPDADNGNIVVAMIDDEATVKKYFKRSDHIVLQPYNSNYAPIKVSKNFRLVGRVMGLIRKY
ncbi:MAG: transcriptional repressor LexA [Candidatus Saganbacteria bacterium]|nr:transcriptional repressor LexA [Candidatus Saganbacteria bacterium]